MTLRDTKVHDVETKDFLKMKELEKKFEAKEVREQELEERLAIQEEQNRKIMELLNDR